eukprot:TRINITY_DN2573_c0_g1_i1.p1 TRINITY_DN2573_c0_g1~~TRINITY_DN2573_c0_g1_i1.p1  ORF type:complete len:172 (-),score=51.62 TRINITY_DN2573_c0_g1_i1:312-797(-)
METKRPRLDEELQSENGKDHVNEQLEPEHPRVLIPKLCRQMYKVGWVTGTGGGISIKKGDEIFIAPSGVQKERMQPEDLFVLNMDEKELERPHKPYKPSQCTPLFFNAYHMRGAGAVIHTHSQHAVMVTLLYQKEFRITHPRNDQGNYKRVGAKCKKLQLQ